MPEVINTCDYIDRVHNKFVEIILNELERESMNLTIIDTVNKCNNILMEELHNMLDEATNKTLAGNKS